MIKVMVVDDSAFTRKVMRKELEEGGYSVIEASGGKEALAIYEKERPDLVTLDLLMPEMEGDEVLEGLKQIDPKVRVVVCTSNVQAMARKEMEELGALGFVNKPVKIADLKPLIDRALKAEV